MDGTGVPSDMATYTWYHHSQLAKVNCMDDAKLVFSDLSAEQIAVSFLHATPPARRKQLIDEIRYGVLLETTTWLAHNLSQGCIKCAPFLQRQMMTPYPHRPIQLLSDEQIPSLYHREQSMAYHILR